MSGLYTLKDAAEVASLLLRSDIAQEVWVFGSIAREGYGNDIDLIVGVDDESFKFYLETLKHDYGLIYDQPGSSRVRLDAAMETLVLPRGTYTVDAFRRVDIFLFPMDWKHRIDEVQDSFDHKDDEFTENLAADARIYHGEVGHFSAPTTGLVWSSSST